MEADNWRAFHLGKLSIIIGRNQTQYIGLVV
jgi:hypothetical protein